MKEKNDKKASNNELKIYRYVAENGNGLMLFSSDDGKAQIISNDNFKAGRRNAFNNNNSDDTNNESGNKDTCCKLM